ncbi:MAG: POTRA domain-containing protein [Alphaproteobacteria bacterium]|nr:POTRA domain-containing protein [Alphaproteobacteria bacterium]
MFTIKNNLLNDTLLKRAMYPVLKWISGMFCCLVINLPCISAQEPTIQDSLQNIDVSLMNLFNNPVPKKYTIAGITVKGNEHFDENLLLSISTLNIGEQVIIPGGDQFAKVIIKLMAQNFFKEVAVYITKLEGTKIWVEIDVLERPRLARFTLKGVKKGDIEELSGKTGLIVNRVITENLKNNAVFAIKDHYKPKGFLDTKVTIREITDSTKKNSTSLIFDINKGPKAHVNNINFGGNTISTVFLKRKMKDVKEKWRFTLFPLNDQPRIVEPDIYTFKEYTKDWGFLTFTRTKQFLDPYLRIKFHSSKFDEKKYIEDKEKIIDYYNSIGYRDAVIEKDLVYKTNNKGDINIDIKLQEGKKYYFGNIFWRGNTKYSDSVLTAILGIQKGDIYNLETFNKKLGRSGASEDFDVSGLYQDDGYLFFRSDPQEIAVYNDTIDFLIKIVEGPQATIKNIRISGNERTKEFVIRRELRVLPGEKFSRTALIRSQREIAQLAFFDQEKIKINPIPNPDDGTVDIEFGVVEKSSDQLELSAGWGGFIGLTGTIGVTFNNFSARNIFNKKGWDPLPVGEGQKLTFRVQSNGKQYQSANFSFTNPWFGGKKRNAFSWNIAYTRFASVFNSTTNQYDLSQADNQYLATLGFGVNYGKQLTWPDDYFQFGVGVNYTRYELKNYPIDALNFPSFNNGFAHNLSFSFSLQRSSIDQPIFPRSGSNVLFRLQLTPPYSLINPDLVNYSNPYQLVEYFKWRFTSEWYVPLGKPRGEDKNQQFVLKFAAKFGFVGRYNNKLQITPFERFQVGDAGISNQFSFLGFDVISQRGYNIYSSSNPRVNPDQGNSSNKFTIFNKYTIELRYPLSLNPSSTIYGLAFFEAANGWYSFQEYNPFELRRSVGLGMRFFLPIFGLLGFDYGVGLDRFTGTNTFSDAAKFTFMLGFESD